MLFPFLIAGCASTGGTADLDRLVRASMTLRGVRPSETELAAVQRDPDALEALARSWLADPRFGETIRDLHAEQLLLRYDTRSHAPAVGPLAGVDDADRITSLDEEPLRLIEHLVLGGRPYSEIVTTDLTMADEVTSAAYGTSYPEGASGWHEARYLDGRPMAGILSSTALLQRHMNSDTNHHRTRANLVQSVLLCDAVSGAVISDPTVQDVSSDPACAGCHGVLDPVASAFYGYDRYFVEGDVRGSYLIGCLPGSSCYPLPMWDPGLTADRSTDAMPDPSLAGVPVGDLSDLGQAIAADPRFPRCTARRFLSYLTQTPQDQVDDADVERFTDRFVAADLDARELALAIAIDPALAPDRTPPRRVKPEALSRLMDDLAGWRWEAEAADYGRLDHGASDEFGFRALMGGVNGWDTVRPDLPPTATRELGLQWIAEEAASVAVDAGRLPPGGPDTDVRKGLRALHLRLLAEPDPDLDPAEALYDGALERSGSARDAWKVTITAMLLDERLVTY